MEWREQSTLSCEVAFAEAQRWVEEVTRKRFGSSNFRSALENGVLLCDLINKLKPGIIKRVNRLSTPIAGLDNVNVFLKACGKLGLNDSQLFHPGDLQDVSTRVTVRREETTRRLKNVLITIYWLGRKAQADPSYSGPQLNFKAFEALLGVALSKTLEESSCPKPSVRDSGYGENWDPDKEDLFSTQQPSYRREDSVESLDSVESRTLSVASDCTLIAGSEGFGSDAEAEHCFRMSERSKSETHSAPSRERANIPIAVRRKRGDQCQDSGRNHASQLPRVPKRHSRHIGSKSMSDIALEPIPQESESSMPFDPRCQGKAGEVTLEHSTIDQVRPKHMQHIKTRVKDSEAKWQDDLDKWKSRRLSANSDLWKKKEEREQLEISSSRGGADGLRTAVLRGVQEESPPDSTNPEEPSSLTLGSSGTELSQQGSEPVQRAKSVEGVISGGTRMSATLPRGFRKSEGGSRLSMGVTPRPFGVKASRVSSLPRIYSMDESHNNLIKGQRERPQLPASFTCQDKVTTPANEGTACSNTQNDSHRKKKKEDEDMDEKNHSAPKVHSFMSASIVASSLKQRATSESEEAKVGHTDMRVSLNQKPNSGRDFGFQAYWDSTGARIKSVQPGSPAQLCHLQAGDEIVAVGGQRVAEMSYEQWKASMGAALKEGSLLMEIRRHGQNDWSNDHLSLQFKSHKTINLTSMASTLIGHPEHCVKVSSCSSLPAEKVNGAKVNGHTVTGFPAKAVNKNIRDIPAVTKNKEYERIIMNNRKRRLAFFMQKGGSDSAISDLQVPSISAVSSRWSWDTEEERRRQEKWQMEQERLLQEKYQRDQERLEAEWRRAQLEAAGEECSGPEQQRPSSLSNGNTTPYTPPPFLYQSTSSTSLSQQAAEVRPVQSRQMTMQIETSHQTKEECDSSAKTSQWPSESYGFTRLTALDRKKSKSTPALDSNHKQDSRVSVKKRGRLSQAEKERQQILEEMRKKTPLHTDSSWIRQRSTCPIYKEPINVAPMRRYDSLDNLHSSSSLSKQFSTMSNPTRPHSALGNITPYRGYSGRCSLGPGAAIFSSSSKRSSCSRPSSTSSMPPVTSGADDIHLNSQQHGRLVSGRRICSRCDHPLGKGAAMVIDSLDLCFHIGCFKCISCRSDLSRGAESRAQVRVRHRQLFCDACYSRLRVRPGIPK
ncbi:LIM domain only protein 7b isoform X8 [Pygocentrus nattereri]|uniref:LIM domain only protein 7b isoform X8 n=1 Tax=Pygocentrus nattereri TaxID=42514 RepID=UPI0008142427|nr:LIM domain only protein 7b isoform X8 [Pygocentrus nattereri]